MIDALPPLKTSRRNAKKFSRFAAALNKNPEARPVDIAMKIYDCKNMRSASVIASQNLTKLNVTMAEIFRREGFSEIDLAKNVIDLTRRQKTLYFANNGIVTDERTVEDNQTQLRAVELAARLMVPPVEKKEGNVFNNAKILIINADDKNTTIPAEVHI